MLLLFCVLLAGVPFAVVAADGPETSAADTLGLAQSLLQEGKAAEARDLLAGQELEFAGSPRYDYLYGMAALDSGRPTEALEPLERVLAVEPDFAGARMELGRAEFEAGDAGAARIQFEYLLTQDPPAPARDVIQRYLDAIDAHSLATNRWVPYVEAGAGYDTNANASTSSSQFLGFDLDPDNVEQSSPFGELAAGVDDVLALQSDRTLLTNARLSTRYNSDATFVNQTIAGAGTTLLMGTGATHFSIGTGGYFGLLDNDSNEWGINADFGVSRAYADTWEVAALVRGALVRYVPGDLQVENVDRYLGVVSLRHVIPGAYGGRFGISFYAGSDDATESGSPYGNKRLGGRVYGSIEMTRNRTLLFDLGKLVTHYDDNPGFFTLDRKDDQWSGMLAAEFRNWPGPQYVISPQLRYVRNDSNIGLYEYDRLETEVTVRYEFR